MTQLLPSIIRTVVPMLVAVLTALLVKLGIDPGPYQDLIAQVAGAVVATAYYVAVRVFETYVKPRFGWLLGYAKQPTYDAPAAPSADSPTGAVATEDTPGVPEGEPVVVIPADEATPEQLPEPGELEDPDAFEGVDEASVGDGTAAVGDVADGVFKPGGYTGDSKSDATFHGRAE